VGGGQPGALRHEPVENFGVVEGQLAGGLVGGSAHRLLREELEPGAAMFHSDLDHLFQLGHVQPVDHGVDHHVGERADAGDAVQGAGVGAGRAADQFVGSRGRPVQGNLYGADAQRPQPGQDPVREHGGVGGHAEAQNSAEDVFGQVEESFQQQALPAGHVDVQHAVVVQQPDDAPPGGQVEQEAVGLRRPPGPGLSARR
jgi:hypothetical protein